MIYYWTFLPSLGFVSVLIPAKTTHLVSAIKEQGALLYKYQNVTVITATALLTCAALATMNPIDLNKVTDSDFGFLSGAWEAEIWGGVFEETWSVPRAGTLTHMGRHTSDGTTGFLEFASIEKKDGKWTMFVMLGAPSTGDKKPTPFVLEKAAKGDITFYSATNDYPTRIRYQGEGKATMTTTLTGKENGQDKTDVFNFKRVK